MADEPAPAKDAEPEPAKEPPAEPEVPPGADNPDAVKRALDAERKAAREATKRADAAEAKVREHEEANSSELEKAQLKAAKAEKTAAEANAKLLRYAVAADKNVPAKLVPLLTGSTKEELETQADLILENAKPADPEFDGGPRDPAPKPQTPEQAHGKFLVDMFRGNT